MIDFKKIIYSKDKIFFNDLPDTTESALELDKVENCMKEAIKQAIPLILSRVAENATTEYEFNKLGNLSPVKFIVNKSSITSLQSQLEKELL